MNLRTTPENSRAEFDPSPNFKFFGYLVFTNKVGPSSFGPLATQQLFQWKFSALLLTKVCRRTAIPFIIKAVPRTNALTRFSQDGLGHQVVSPTFYGLALCRFLIRKLKHFFSLSIKVVDTKYLYLCLCIKLANQTPMESSAYPLGCFSF